MVKDYDWKKLKEILEEIEVGELYKLKAIVDFEVFEWEAQQRELTGMRKDGKMIRG